MCKRILASQTNSEYGVPFYKIGTIGGIPDAYISQELFELYQAKYNYPRKGEVMITCAGTIGKTIMFDGNDSYYQDSNIVWIDNPTNKFDNTFLYHFISKVDWSKLNTTTIVRIYNDDLRQLKISYPTLTEQRKISIFLNLLDERIATQIKIIEKLESLIRGLYERLFNIDGAAYIQLGNVAKIQKGQQINGEELSEIGSYYVMNGGVVPSGYLEDFNTPANTISISEGGNSCGYVQYNGVPFWSGGHCYTLIEPINSFNYKYLFHYLKFKEQSIMALRIGSGLPNIQKKDLERFPILNVSKEEQDKMACIFDDILDRIICERQIALKYEEQKKYLLSNLFI